MEKKEVIVKKMEKESMEERERLRINLEKEVIIIQLMKMGEKKKGEREDIPMVF